MRRISNRGKTAAFALAVLAGGCGFAPEKKAVTAAAYAAPSACAGCHAAIAKSYAQTGMGRSIGAPTAPKPGSVTHRPSAITYNAALRGGTLYLRRHQTGFDSKEANVVERRADFAIGSGNHARSFLSRNREGKYVELPLTWYAENGGYWEMSPGFERAGQEDFRRVVPDECLFCHSSYTQEPLQAIDCQRCHGPGQAHASSGGREAILNPKRLSRDRQLDVCMQCHLETTSSPLPNSIRRFEREVFSYGPGEPLGDYALFFDHAAGTGHDDKFEIAGAAYRLRKSLCFQKSAMTCSTCHDPHAVRRGSAAAGCKQCHAAAHNQGTTCLDCHMPKRRTEDAVHVVMTDHFIQRRPVNRTRPEPVPYRGEVALYYPPLAPPGSEAYLAVAQVQHGSNLAVGIPRLEAAIAKFASTRPELYFELGKAFAKKGDEESAVKWYEEALRRQPGFRPAVKGLAASLLALQRFDRAAELLSVERAPDARMMTNHGQALLESGRTEEAVTQFNRAVAANPDLPEPHDLLGLAWLRRGAGQRAEAEFREAVRLQPDLASAHSNLASLYAGRQDLARSEYHFAQALAIDPARGETHRNFAFLLILMRDYDRARTEFETAVRLDPSKPQVRIDLAELELAAGRTEVAAAQYRLALKQSPGFAEAHFGLGKLLITQGRAGEGIAELRVAVQANPRLYEAQLALGVLLLRAGDVTEARAHLERAGQSEDAAIREMAGKALAQSGTATPR